MLCKVFRNDSIEPSVRQLVKKDVSRYNIVPSCSRLKKQNNSLLISPGKIIKLGVSVMSIQSPEISAFHSDLHGSLLFAGSGEDDPQRRSRK